LSCCVGLILQWFILLLSLCFVCFLSLLPLMANKVVCVIAFSSNIQLLSFRFVGDKQTIETYIACSSSFRLHV